MENFGHDAFQYPAWIVQEMKDCTCSSQTLRCRATTSTPPQEGLTFCAAKDWLLSHMPRFDLDYLPPSVWVRGGSMLDDNIAFALMALRSVPWLHRIPRALLLSYILPYATTHEARVNWRPLLFAKFFPLIATLFSGPSASSVSTVQAMQLLASPPWGPATPNTFANWSAHQWPGYPQPPAGSPDTYWLRWSSSSTPPVLSPFDFAAYGYASCTGTATLLAYVARAVGIPARVSGTPCWNSFPYAGLATENKNVSQCWQGGNATSVGGSFLFNHNWVEYWNTETQEWSFINVPPETAIPDQGLANCVNFSLKTGCSYSNATGCKKATFPGAAMRDHEILSWTWDFEGENGFEGGAVVDVKDLRLSSGEPVSPLVWSPRLQSPLGTPLKNIGLRFVNRTDFYRCKAPHSA